MLYSAPTEQEKISLLITVVFYNLDQFCHLAKLQNENTQKLPGPKGSSKCVSKIWAA